MRLISLATSFALAVGAFQAIADEAQVIYGEDNRLDLFEADVSDMERRLAASTVALVQRSDLRINGADPSILNLPTATFGSSFGLCSSEQFRHQPNPAFCSGFLVGEDVIATAGHCIRSSNCADVAFVFDFAYATNGDDPTSVSRDNVYRCSSIIDHRLDGGRGSDWALVKLDRAVTDREPVEYRASGHAAEGTPLVVIGHPSGLPTKVAAGAAIRTSRAGSPYFVANLDTYGGNSGSAVFNSFTGVVEGILVRGETDFVTRGGCRVSYRCSDDGCRGEDVTKTTEFASSVP